MWPNRDPSQESGSLNLYCFVSNDGVNEYDCLGLAEVGKNAAGGTVVTVEPCEVVFYEGHGNPRNSPFFSFPLGCSAAAGFLGCYATTINALIPKEGDTLIPNAPTIGGPD